MLFRHNSKIKLALKPKRHYNSAHDTVYTDYVNSLVKTKQLELIPPETNLFEIIAQSTICISYPFASTAIIAKELKVPSLYYLENDILKAYNKVHGINFVDTKIGLLKFVEKYVIEELK
jgi:polysaccharide biosynthesis PFTS motif protein